MRCRPDGAQRELLQRAILDGQLALAEAARMDIGVEISLYPLEADFKPVIREFLARLNTEAGLRIVTNSMSTQVFGAYEQVMSTLQRELRTTFAALEPQARKAVFVMKVLGPLPSA